MPERINQTKDLENYKLKYSNRNKSSEKTETSEAENHFDQQSARITGNAFRKNYSFDTGSGNKFLEIANQMLFKNIIRLKEEGIRKPREKHSFKKAYTDDLDTSAAMKQGSGYPIDKCALQDTVIEASSVAAIRSKNVRLQQFINSMHSSVKIDKDRF